MHKFFELIDHDDAIRVGVLTGKGRVFCAGYDFAAGGGDFSVYGKAKSAEGIPLFNLSAIASGEVEYLGMVV